MRIATRPVASEKLLAPSGERMWRLGAKRQSELERGERVPGLFSPSSTFSPVGRRYVALALLAAQD